MSQQDWSDGLAAEIASGQIVVHESDKAWFNLLSRRFPVRASGICWEQVANARFRHAGEASPTSKESDFRTFLEEFASVANLGPADKCVIVGDNTSSSALEMNLHVLLDIAPSLLSEPQSLYVIVKEAEWCFAYTFEDDMYFARVPS
jgi:hypothetical protein